MNNPLETYLADHLAGAMHAIELTKNIRDEYHDAPLGRFAAELATEIEADRDVLQNLAERVGGGPSKTKELTAWVTEKFSRLKLRHGEKNGLGVFESLETLALGILGKLSLWRALAEIAPEDPRIQQIDLAKLTERAQDQHGRVERLRLEFAQRVLHS